MMYLITLNILLIHISCGVTPSDEALYEKYWKTIPTEVYSSDLLKAVPNEVRPIDKHFYVKGECGNGLQCWRHIPRCPRCEYVSRHSREIFWEK